MMAFNDESTDRENMSRFFEAYKRPLLKFAYSILNDYELAADAVQGSFLNLMKAYDDLRSFSDERLLAYSWPVVRHECSKIIRQNRSQHLEDDDLSAFVEKAIASDPCEVIIKEQALHDSIQKLPAHYRLAIEMKYFYDSSDAAIAKVLDVKPGSVRMILSRARARLKELYFSEEVKAHV